MVEVVAVVSIAAVGALWKIATEHGAIREGMRSILSELQKLRNEIAGDIMELQKTSLNHEKRITRIERLMNDN